MEILLALILSRSFDFSANERRLEESEIRFLRHVAGYTVWDKEKGDETGSQLEMRKSDKQIDERKKNWLQNLQRMPSERVPKQLFKPIFLF